MAGWYADVPAPRMAVDKDGTQWIKYTNAMVPTNLTAGEISAVCDWSTSGVDPGSGGGIAMVFPEKRDLVAVTVSTSQSGGALNMSFQVETSVNTTNGIDGTWVAGPTVSDANARQPISGPYGRTGIVALAVNGIRGVRVKGISGNSNGSQSIHVYGTVSGSQVGVDRLAFWHPTLDQELGGAYLDWGDVKRGTTETRTFRIKNLSATKTANSPRVAMEALTDTTPAVVGQHQISIDNATWVSQYTGANLAPGAITGLYYVRRTTPLTAVLSIWNMRLFAESTTWS